MARVFASRSNLSTKAASDDVAAGPGGVPRVARVWLDAEKLERAGYGAEGADPERAVRLYQAAAELFEQLAEEQPDLSAAYWTIPGAATAQTSLMSCGSIWNQCGLIPRLPVTGGV